MVLLMKMKLLMIKKYQQISSKHRAYTLSKFLAFRKQQQQKKGKTLFLRVLYTYTMNFDYMYSPFHSSTPYLPIISSSQFHVCIFIFIFDNPLNLVSADHVHAWVCGTMHWSLWELQVATSSENDPPSLSTHPLLIVSQSGVGPRDHLCHLCRDFGSLKIMLFIAADQSTMRKHGCTSL